MSLSRQTIGFIGSGNMATALISGLLANGHTAQQIIASDPDADRVDTLTNRYGIKACQNNVSVVNASDVVILAVKPQIMRDVVEPLKEVMQQHKPLVVSIAAGVRTEALLNWLGVALPLVRCMPSTPALLQASATGLYATKQVMPEQKQLVEAILVKAGIVQWFEHEADLDAVTAISGSGPAYFFLIMEAMEQAGQEMGLTAATARQFSAQTAFGAARMVLESEDSPATLRAKVTSPGGTTERAIQSMQQDKLQEIVVRAIHAAKNRAIELSK